MGVRAWAHVLILNSEDALSPTCPEYVTYRGVNQTRLRALREIWPSASLLGIAGRCGCTGPKAALEFRDYI